MCISTIDKVQSDINGKPYTYIFVRSARKKNYLFTYLRDQRLPTKEIDYGGLKEISGYHTVIEG